MTGTPGPLGDADGKVRAGGTATFGVIGADTEGGTGAAAGAAGPTTAGVGPVGATAPFLAGGDAGGKLPGGATRRFTSPQGMGAMGR